VIINCLATENLTGNAEALSLKEVRVENKRAEA
jgi:hypothetical protein